MVKKELIIVLVQGQVNKTSKNSKKWTTLLLFYFLLLQ